MGWTDQQIQTLRKMWGNHSASEIARTLGGGVSRNAVIGKAHRLKLSVRVAGSAVPDVEPGHMGGNVMASMTKVKARRVMLRPLPPVPVPEKIARAVIKTTTSPAEALRKSEGIAVLKAGERHCRWPVGDPLSPDFRFCGCTCHEGLPYCVDHARVAYQNVSRRSRAADIDAGESRVSVSPRY